MVLSLDWKMIKFGKISFYSRRKHGKVIFEMEIYFKLIKPPDFISEML